MYPKAAALLLSAMLSVKSLTAHPTACHVVLNPCSCCLSRGGKALPTTLLWPRVKSALAENKQVGEKKTSQQTSNVKEIIQPVQLPTQYTARPKKALNQCNPRTAYLMQSCWHFVVLCHRLNGRVWSFEQIEALWAARNEWVKILRWFLSH